MIKINLTNERAILDFYLQNLIQKRGKEWNLNTYLNNRINKYSAPNHINRGLISFYSYLKKLVNDKNYSTNILTAKPKILEKHKVHIESNYLNELNTPLAYDKNGKIIQTVKDELLNVFYYDTYNKWKAYELAKKIGVQVCPYCNRNYTFIVGSDDNKGTRFQYDHFFDKASFPYLALSFYNLVPSCNTCNSDLKGSDKFSITENIHPYLEGFSPSILFSIKAKNVGFVNGQSKSYRIKFKLNPEFKKSEFDKSKIKAAIRNISTFRLSELYNMHKDYVDEIIQKSYIYNQSYISDLFKNHPDLFKSEDDVKRMVLGNYINESDYSKRPLSKLTADIARELKILD